MALSNPAFHKMPVPSEPLTGRSDLTPLSTVDLYGTDRHRLPLGERFFFLAIFFREQFNLSSNDHSREMYRRAQRHCAFGAQRHGYTGAVELPLFGRPEYVPCRAVPRGRGEWCDPSCDRTQMPAPTVDVVCDAGGPLPHASEVAWMRGL